MMVLAVNAHMKGLAGWLAVCAQMTVLALDAQMMVPAELKSGSVPMTEASTRTEEDL